MALVPVFPNHRIGAFNTVYLSQHLIDSNLSIGSMVMKTLRLSAFTDGGKDGSSWLQAHPRSTT